MNSGGRKAAMFLIECKRGLAEGKSISRIAKETGFSYKHTKRICERIKQEGE